MRKQIYSNKTKPSDFYGRQFPDFVLSLGGERIYTGTCDLQQGFPPHEHPVALDYHFQIVGETTVNLRGNEEEIGEVEKLILAAVPQV